LHAQAVGADGLGNLSGKVISAHFRGFCSASFVRSLGWQFNLHKAGQCFRIFSIGS